MKRRRTTRCPADLWEEAAQRAASENTTLSDVISAFLTDYVAEESTTDSAVMTGSDDGR